MLGGDRRELVDDHHCRYSSSLQARDGRLQVLDDRRPKDLCEQGTTVGLEVEVDDRPRPRRIEEIELVGVLSLRIEPRTHLRLGQDREPVADARKIAALTCRERIEIGVAGGRV